MDLSQILMLLNSQNNLFGGQNNNTQSNTSNIEKENKNEDNTDFKNQSSSDFSTNSENFQNNFKNQDGAKKSGFDNNILTLLLPLMMSGNLNQNSLVDFLSKTNPELASIMSLLPKDRGFQTKAKRNKNKMHYVRVSDYYKNSWQEGL